VKKLLKIGFSIFVLLLVSACNDSTKNISNDPNSQITYTNQPNEVGTSGQLIPIQSSNVSAAGYNDASAVMTVQFKSGALYEYYEVPPELWVSFVAAQPHPWSQVGYPQLVQGGYGYSRIN
jgi:hypothetical protein